MKKIKEKVEQYLDLYTKTWAFSGAIAVFKQGEIIYKNVYGYASIEHKIQNTTTTKFKLWSLTKQFTAVAILMLEEKGLLKVEDRFIKYFPEFKDFDERITIHHLLSHTSGLFNFTNIPKSQQEFQKIKHKKNDLINKYASMSINFEPGTNWEYSNTGYYLLGELIERISGKNYALFLKENIFIPLGMNNTGVDDDKTIIENMANGYYLDGNDLTRCNYLNSNVISAAGAIYSTVEDLFLWDQSLRNESLLSKASIDKMNTPYLANYGYGVWIHHMDNRKIVHHNGGGDDGFISEIHRYVDEDITIVILSNYGFTAVHKLCRILSKIFFEENYELPMRPDTAQISNDIIDSYLGVYQVEGFKVELKKESDQLYFTINDEYNFNIYPVSENLFHHKWIDEEYEITKDEDGQLYFWGIKKQSVTQ